MLDTFAGAKGISLAALGIHAVDGGRQPRAFSVIDACRDAGSSSECSLTTSGSSQASAGSERLAGAWSQRSWVVHALAHGRVLAQRDELFVLGDSTWPAQRRRRIRLCATAGSKSEHGAQAPLAHYTEE